MVWIFTRKSAALIALGLASVLAFPSAGRADDPPVVTRAPDISGTPVVGQTLRAVDGQVTAGPDAAVNNTWYRCPNDDFEDCSLISGATSDSYVVVDKDVGKTIRTGLIASQGEDSSSKISEPTAVVQAAAGSTPSTPSTPTFTLTPPTTIPGPAIAGAKRIKPKPVISISGRYTSTGAIFTRFTVKAPKGATTTLACSKGTCPAKKQTIKGGHTSHLAKFEKRTLKAGTRVQLTIARKGYVSEVTIITIRRKLKPTRSDSCVLPGKTKRQKCPA